MLKSRDVPMVGIFVSNSQTWKEFQNILTLKLKQKGHVSAEIAESGD